MTLGGSGVHPGADASLFFGAETTKDGIEIAFPTRTITIDKSSLPLADARRRAMSFVDFARPRA